VTELEGAILRADLVGGRRDRKSFTTEVMEDWEWVARSEGGIATEAQRHRDTEG
jgi:hypothetical protein